MSVISVTVSESSVQIVSGIPRTISLSTNIPSSIFYTLDGTVPDTSSSLYIGTFVLPTNNSGVVLTLFATNGIDSSAIITKTYSGNTENQRNTHDQVFGPNAQADNRANSFPFGNPFIPTVVTYGNTVGLNVSIGDQGIPDGYDGTGTGTPANRTNLPISDYPIRYSETDSEGQRGRGIGNLPSNVVIRVPIPVPPSTSTDANSPFFNPKAVVIYQDSRNPAYDADLPMTNRQFFSLENPETARDGALLFNTGFDGLQSTGALVRQHYNPRENTITYYYFDSATLRWIISTEPYVPKANSTNNLSRIVFGRGDSANKVYKWFPFSSRRLI